MDDLPKITPRTGLGRVISRIINYIRSIALKSSNDFIINRTATGTTISLASHLREFRNDYVRYLGEYEPNNGFKRNDDIRAMPDTNYVLGDSLTPLDVTPGVWRCVADVPEPAFSDLLIDEGITTGPDIRIDGVKYHPIWPEPENTAEDVVDSTDPFTRANIRYWEFISGLPVKVTSKIDGVCKDVYVDMFDSGSVSP